MNSGPTASTIVSERIRLISAMADASICQAERAAIGASWSGLRAPQSAIVESSPVENPTQGEMDDTPSIICLREPVEPFDRPQVLLKPRRLELRVDLSQVVPCKLRLRRHAAERRPLHNDP